MKKFTLFLGSFLVLTFSGCNLEPMSDLDASESAKKSIKGVENNDVPTDDAINLNDGTHCEVIRLMAGQHYEAGIITVDNDGQNLIITYSTNNEWTINATHLSIIDCSTESFPSTSAGNPKIGQFEYNDTFTDGVHVVVYIIPLSEVSENYCFAAHAEVTGPTGEETAWGEGKDFGGKSWAMYIDANLSDCNGGGLGYG